MTKSAAVLLDDRVHVSSFKAEVRRWAERIGAEPKEVRVRPMKRKWASCSSAGRLTFDSAILNEPTAFRDQVVVHELLHLKVPNHGPLFRSMLRAHLGADGRIAGPDER
jgi:predicted metal-dependent hydrolase